MADIDGWKTLKPPARLLGLGVFCAVLAVGALVWSVIVGGAVLKGARTQDAILALTMGPPFAALLAFIAACMFLVQVRYGWQGVERISLGRRSLHAWHEIEAIRRHPLLGPQLVLKRGKPVAVWEYLRGFDEFLAYAGDRVAVEDAVRVRPDLPDF